MIFSKEMLAVLRAALNAAPWQNIDGEEVRIAFAAGIVMPTDDSSDNWLEKADHELWESLGALPGVPAGVETDDNDSGIWIAEYRLPDETVSASS